VQRRAIQVRGIVQGVGFRPYVFGLASQLSLRGFVRNQAGSVSIEVEGQRDALDSFLDELTSRPPPLARIQEVSWQELDCLGQPEFRIEPSQAEHGSPVFVSPDIGTCDACLAELFDPGDRRYRYPFINCTHCGPRLTIITGAPYDRPQTTMAGFAMCDACRAEYENPADRRFHAQPIACPQCGPSLQLLDAAGARMDCPDPLADFAQSIADGMTGAMKGLGGFHLVCDATNAAAVHRLRQRKHRDEKPLAIMVANVSQARRWCHVSAEEQKLLASSRKPIVLLRKRSLPKGTTGELADSIAPRNPWLGLMLPYTPLHHLLLDALDGRPLVMTSGNQADEPIAYRDGDAPRQLAGIADCFLTHDRPIHMRCDDSLVRVIDGRELPIRRSRGYAPEPIGLPLECPLPVLAVGGQLKGTFALSRGAQAIVSHHLGDLDHYEAYRAFIADIELYERLFDVRPKMLVHDLHPDYGSTRYARERAATESLELLAVQHHHAHLASCLADNGLCEPAIGVTFDGTGYGLDGAIWGGEFLIGDYAGFRRAAHVRYVGMPGGEQAVREPWRMALAHLLDAGCDPALLEPAVPRAQLRMAEQMLDKRLNSPITSSVGRLFDAVAALAGLRQRVSYEGQAAVELEWLASEAPGAKLYPYEITSPDAHCPPSPLVGEGPGVWGRSTFDSSSPPPLVIDTRPLVRALAADCQRAAPREAIARAFHETLADIICDVCTRLRTTTGLNLVALTGGVFLNSVLTSLARRRLEQQDFRVVTHARVPPNDGGLSLGQLAIAAHALQP
jgi:hydrogenase maturation protein HypF